MIELRASGATYLTAGEPRAGYSSDGTHSASSVAAFVGESAAERRDDLMSVSKCSSAVAEASACQPRGSPSDQLEVQVRTTLAGGWLATP